MTRHPLPPRPALRARHSRRRLPSRLGLRSGPDRSEPTLKPGALAFGTMRRFHRLPAAIPAARGPHPAVAPQEPAPAPQAARDRRFSGRSVRATPSYPCRFRARPIWERRNHRHLSSWRGPQLPPRTAVPAAAPAGQPQLHRKALRHPPRHPAGRRSGLCVSGRRGTGSISPTARFGPAATPRATERPSTTSSHRSSHAERREGWRRIRASAT